MLCYSSWVNRPNTHRVDTKTICSWWISKGKEAIKGRLMVICLCTSGRTLFWYVWHNLVYSTTQVAFSRSRSLSLRFSIIPIIKNKAEFDAVSHKNLELKKRKHCATMKFHVLIQLSTYAIRNLRTTCLQMFWFQSDSKKYSMDEKTKTTLEKKKI